MIFHLITRTFLPKRNISVISGICTAYFFITIIESTTGTFFNKTRMAPFILRETTNTEVSDDFSCSHQLLNVIIRKSTLSSLWYIHEEKDKRNFQRIYPTLKIMEFGCETASGLLTEDKTDLFYKEVKVNLIINCPNINRTLEILDTLADVAEWQSSKYDTLKRSMITVLFFTYERFPRQLFNFTTNDDIYLIEIRNNTVYTDKYLQLGEWENIHMYTCFNKEMDSTSPIILTDQFTGFEGKSLLVGTELYTPFSRRKRRRNGTYYYYGFCFDVLKDIAAKLNFRHPRCNEVTNYLFSYKIVRPQDKKFGVEQKDGTWNGVIGMLIRQEIDLIMTGLTVTSERERVVDFTYPFWTEYSAVIMRLTGTDQFRLFRPLHYTVWVAFFISITCATLAIWGIDHFSFLLQNKKSTSNIRCFSMESVSWLQQQMMYNYGAALLQGIPKLHKNVSTRAITASVLIVPVLLFATYSGNLIATLSVHKFTYLFNTLEDIAEDTEHTLVINKGGAHRSLLESAKSGLYAKLWDKIKNNPNSLAQSTNIGVRKMFSEKKYLAMSDYTSLLVKAVRANRCDWAFLPELFYPAGLAMAIPQSSPYREIFSKVILEIEEAGLVEKYMQQRRPFDRCTFTRKTSFANNKITLPDLQMLFVILFLGLFISVCVLAFERIIFYTFRKRTHL